MGFFGAVFGAIGGICSAIGGALGGALGIAATAIAGLVGSPVFGAVVGLISLVSTVLGLTKKDEKQEELGAKAMLSDKKPEDFDSYQAYIDHISDIKLTPEMKDRLKTDEGFKTQCTSIGASMQWYGLNEKMGINMDIPSFVKLVEAGVKTPEQFQAIASTFKSKEVEPKINDAIECKLPMKEKAEVMDTLKEGVDKVEGSKEIWEKLDKMLDEI
ncbi:hypothetical protein [Fusobacterium pseudoperiodonticum]|jgi:hypothetical protein|uniref:hypothetical protein n=1 Tax=Fusobacterium pseudoperiodonticum TaxID=2663009 RepID=UPI001CB090EB|nr:hypothetical protein [Fusobacterium periodonticum]MDU5802796.1 hypothetical protein [Fusobacterium periodonticum]